MKTVTILKVSKPLSRNSWKHELLYPTYPRNCTKPLNFSKLLIILLDDRITISRISLEFFKNTERFKFDKNLTNLETFYPTKISKLRKSHERIGPSKKIFFLFKFKKSKRKTIKTFETHSILKLKNHRTLNCFKKKYHVILPIWIHSKAWNFYSYALDFHHVCFFGDSKIDNYFCSIL